ncbi:MAG: SGNH/GDSL hydrolase family protein [Deltaproteobacteria bacterium]|nr:SGNH/GDSL hydrolase family protein [Deltaproteobacteria bacterium]
MKRYLLRASLFVLVFAGSLEALTAIASRLAALYHKTPAYSGTFANYSWTDRLEHSPKVLIMGSSAARYGVSPTVLARKGGYLSGEVVNLAFDARNPVQTYYVWKSLSEQVKSSVRLVVYGFEPWTFYQNYYAYDDFAITQWGPVQRLDVLFNANFDSQTRKKVLRYSFLRSGLGQSIRNSFGFLQKNRQILATPPDFGAIELKARPRNFSGNARESFVDKALFPVSDFYFSYLKRLKDEVEARGIRFVLFTTPKASEWTKDYSSSCQDVERETLTKLNGALGPVILIDAMGFMPEPEKMGYMADNAHLNDKGQKAFSAYLAKRLQLLEPKQPAKAVARLYAY